MPTESNYGSILILLESDNVSDARLEQVRSIAPGREIIVSPAQQAAGIRVDTVEIAAGNVHRTDLGRMKNVAWIQQWGAGADWLMRYPQNAFEGAVITNASGIHAVPISEHILGYLLCFARRFHYAILGQRDRIWEPNRPMQQFFELPGKTVVLVGVGAIGSEFARKAAALGLTVIGVRKHPEKETEGISHAVSPEQLHDVLPAADFLVLTVPLTRETMSLIGEAELKLMKRSAYLVNIGRGRTIDQKALVRALDSGWIAGAGLDVFEEEPLPGDSPLWDMDQVIVTPHCSGLTPEYHCRAWEIFLDNLERYVTGEPLRNIVDQKSGY